MHEVEQLCDRIAFINKGYIADIGTIKNVKMKQFSTYDVIIKVKAVKNRKFLIKKGFTITGRTLRKKVSLEENISEILAMLNEMNFEVVDVETKKPTLEDYFVKIIGEKK